MAASETLDSKNRRNFVAARMTPEVRNKETRLTVRFRLNDSYSVDILNPDEVAGSIDLKVSLSLTDLS